MRDREKPIDNEEILWAHHAEHNLPYLTYVDMTLDMVAVRYKQATQLLHEYNLERDPYCRDPDAVKIAKELLSADWYRNNTGAELVFTITTHPGPRALGLFGPEPEVASRGR